MKISTLLLILIFSAVSFAQKPSDTFTVYLSKAEQPLLIINENIVASVDILRKVSSDKLAKLDISKDDVLSTTGLFPLDEKNKGIIRVDTNIELAIKTQSELNSFFDLNTTNDIYVNGYLLEDKEQTISTNSIKMIDLREADGLILKTPSLNITIE